MIKRTTSKAFKKRMSNAGISSSAGEFGEGDRGAYNYVPQNTGNPYDSHNYLHRWRQYVHLYETSWEARKIIKVPIEDALRKPWVPGGIPEDMSSKIEQRLQELDFNRVLSRSMMLERLLGGCLTFLGLEDKNDDPGKAYDPREGKRLCFLNAIPVSRITRINWETSPLSPRYMRPNQYLIHGTPVHASRCLVWDGEPLFDPSDFYLTTFQVNLAGFGPSRLATVWDDIIKAVGTRQAAFQLIKTNNALIMAIKDLQDLAGTDPGKAQIKIIKDVANHLSLYRAAIVDSEKVDIRQNAASFGSVPELIITFIQVLSAASDIPATRFLGQPPGGLDASGSSDLENYYNVIDTIQVQRIKPQIRYMYDVLGYAFFPKEWENIREGLELTFPPMWNETASEEAERHSIEINNVTQLLDMGLMGDEKALEELNLRGVLSVELEEDDLQILDDVKEVSEEEEQGTKSPQEQISRLRKSSKNLNAVEKKKGEHKYTFYNCDIIIEASKGEVRRGMNIHGEPWEVKSPADYGYIKNTKGADGDIDVYVGSVLDSNQVFVVDQKNILTGYFDEHKIILCVANIKEATDLFISGFSDNKGEDRIGSISALSSAVFLKWLSHGDTKVAYYDKSTALTGATNAL